MATGLGQQSGGSAEDITNEAERLLKMLENHEPEDSRSAQFLQQMRERFEQYGSRTQVSAKQLFWLRDIKDKSL
jgi:hypothetical protein